MMLLRSIIGEEKCKKYWVVADHLAKVVPPSLIGLVSSTNQMPRMVWFDQTIITIRGRWFLPQVPSYTILFPVVAGTIMLQLILVKHKPVVINFYFLFYFISKTSEAHIPTIFNGKMIRKEGKKKIPHQPIYFRPLNCLKERVES